MNLRVKKTLPALLCFILSLNLNIALASSEKDTIRIGIFIESLYDIDFSTYSYQSNFWMWSIAKGDINEDGKTDRDDSIASIQRIKLIELSNAKTYDYSHQMAYREEKDGKTYWLAEQFCRASIYQKWMLNNYPFDAQELVLKFENSSYDTTEAIMLNEQDSLTFKEDINLIGWTISNGEIQNSIVKYNTDFGDPNGNGTSYYSRVVFKIGLARISSVAYFIKLCLGAFIAFLVAVLAFAIVPPNLDSRLGLGVGALFAVAANKYVVDLSIPENATNCLVDKIHEVTFVYILLTLIASAITLILHERKKNLHRKIFDRAAAFVIFITYLFILLQYWLAAQV